MLITTRHVTFAVILLCLFAGIASFYSIAGLSLAGMERRYAYERYCTFRPCEYVKRDLWLSKALYEAKSRQGR